MGRRLFAAGVIGVLLCSISFGYSGWIAGKIGNALAFDGVNDYVEVPGYKGIIGTTSRTCCAWIKTSTTQQSTIISWGGDQTGQRWFFRVEANGTLALGVTGGYVYTTATVNTGQWHHVAAVLNDDGSPSVNEVLLYIDGVLQSASATSTQAIGAIASQDVMIGAYKSAGVPTSYFNGLLDDVRIYSRALESNELDLQAPMPTEGLAAYWAMDETEGNIAHDSVYSYHGILRNMYSGGNGTAADPYRIATKENLLVLAATATDYNKSFILIEDIDLGGQIFTKAIIASDISSLSGFQGTPFTGTFDGNGHRITNFTINGGGNSFLGLFGCIDSGSQIKKLGLETCIVSGSSGIGSLVGYFYGGSSGSISNCYSTGSTISGSYAGGLVGVIGFGSISQCYSTSSVTGTSNVGGLVGYNDFGGSVSGSFWDTQTSGRTTSAGGTGKTTVQMKTLSTFTSAGWDFVNTWFMPSNDYPRLSLTTVPDVVGMTKAAAQTAITGARLFVGNVTQTFSDSVTVGNIISQSPASGTSVCVGSTVNLVVSLGKLVVPNVVGMTQTAAQTAITTAGLTVGSVTQTFNDSVPAGNVISQSPAAGQTVSAVIAVNFIISMGPLLPGSGTVDNPYQIWTAKQLYSIGFVSDQWNKNFIVMADIDMSAYAGTLSKSVIPQFSGTFDGNGYTISNLVINQAGSDRVGLFGYVGSAGKIKNLGVVNANIQGQFYVGGLAGYNYGAITSCYVTGTVNGKGYVGGLAGYNSAAITTCYAMAVVSGTSDYVGGLIGYMEYGGLILSSYATGNVSGKGYVGGLAGYYSVYDGTITSSHATGMVSGTGSYVGGLVGYLTSATSSCYATGIVTGTSYVGGLAGYLNGTISSCCATGMVSGTGSYIGGLVGNQNSGTTTFCYATGAVGGTGNYVGGLVGAAGGTLTSCYAAGTVSGTSYVGGLVGVGGVLTSCCATGAVSGIGSYIGGLTGSGFGSTKSCFWDVQTSGQSGSSSGKGLTTEQMKTLSIFQNADWAGKGWVINDGQDYPHLSWENTGGSVIPPAVIPFAGSGTATDPYRISTAQEFALLSWYSSILDKQTKLDANLDLSGVQLYPIGDLGRFTGVFDGSGHTISNAVIDQPGSDRVGLFSCVSSGGKIKNLGVVNVDIQGQSYVGGLVGFNDYSYSEVITFCYVTGTVGGAERVGGLAGYNYGFVTSCHATVTVSGTNYIGGLVGYNDREIISSYATGAVHGDSYVGGLVGYNDLADISSCYATGSVSGTNTVGGLAGENSGRIFYCYAKGLVSGGSCIGGMVGYIDVGYSTVNYCFWDTQTSGQTIGVGYGTVTGITGKTTTQMKTLSTFTSAGWDFINGTNDNLEHVWFIREGQEYPRFIWEIQQSRDGLIPLGFTTINKTRIRRTTFEYELAVVVRNSNSYDMTNVQLKLMDWDTAVQSVSDDSVTIDAIPAGATVTSTDTFKIVVDRSTLIASSRLTWELTYYVPAYGTKIQQTASMLLSSIDAIPGDITGDGKVNLEDFAIMARQWNDAPGNPSADIAPPPDGHVGIEDLIYLAENWLTGM